jgi:hypothetical protein
MTADPTPTTPTATVVPTPRAAAMTRTSVANLATQSGWNAERVAEGNVLIFPAYVRQISDMHQIKLEMVTVDTSPLSNDLYDIDGEKAATKVLLERMSNLAGLQFDPVDHVYPEPGVFVAKARGGVRGPDGLIAYKTASKEWIREVVELELEKRAAAAIAAKKLTLDYKPTWLREQMGHEMKERGTKTETKAKNRVRREVLGLPGKAPLSYWQKPFFVPRIDILIDPSDPETRKRVFDQAFGASRFLGYDNITDVEPIGEETTS